MLFLKTAIPVLTVISVLASNVAGQECYVGQFLDSDCSGNVAQTCDAPERKPSETDLDYAKSLRNNQICTKYIQSGKIEDLTRDGNGGYYYYRYDFEPFEVNDNVNGDAKESYSLSDYLNSVKPPPKKERVRRTCEDGSPSQDKLGCKFKVPVTVPSFLGPEDLRGCLTDDSLEKLDGCREFSKGKGVYLHAWRIY